MEDKKDFFNFVIYAFSFFIFFLHLTHPQMESAVDEVRSIRCTVGSRQDATGWCHVSTEYYKATIMTWSLLNRTRVGLKHTQSLSQIQLSAANAAALFQLGERTRCWCRTEIFNDMHRPRKKKASKQKMHNCNALWINSLLQGDWIGTFRKMTRFRR